MEVLVMSKSFIIREAMSIFLNNSFDDCNVIQKNEFKDILNLDLPKIEILFIDAEKGIIDHIVKLKEHYKNLKVIVYNKTNDKDIILNCFKHKVESCVSDISDKEEFTYIVNTVKRGKKYYDLDLLDDIFNNPYIENDDIKTLTDRESEVLEMVSDGHTNKEIAKNLYISEHTVKKHITNILSKLDMRNRKDLIIYKKENNIYNYNLA